MKKLICIFMAIFMIVALSACEQVPKSDFEELQKKIEQLEEQINNQKIELENKLKDQHSSNAELEELIRNQELKSALLQELLNSQYEDLELIQKKLENLTGIEIKFTAEAPVYGFREGEQKYKSFDSRLEDNFSPFIDYVKNEFIPQYNYDFYLLKPEDAFSAIYDTDREYSIMVERIGETPINPIIKEYMTIYDDVLGDPTWYKNNGMAGAMKWSIWLNIHLAPLPENFEKWDEEGNVSRLYIEFGNNDPTYAMWPKYFNIYVRDTCIGTCYYLTNTYVSHTWFEKYIIEHLC